MRQYSVVLKINTPTSNNYATLFHIYEMGLFLADSGFDVIYWVDSIVEKELDWDLKYMQSLPVIFEEDQLPKNYMLITDTASFHIDNLDSIKKIFFVNNPLLEESLNTYEYKFIKNKSYLLYSAQLDQSFLNTDTGYTFFELDRAIEYEYGIYNKYLLNTHTNNDKWFLANTNCTAVISEFIDEFVKDRNISYDTVCNNIALHNNYVSLLYANCRDFFIRLPFEFSLASKKVIMFDCDPVFRNLTPHQLWNHPYIIEDIPMLNLDLNMFKNN